MVGIRYDRHFTSSDKLIFYKEKKQLIRCE